MTSGRNTYFSGCEILREVVRDVVQFVWRRDESVLSTREDPCTRFICAPRYFDVWSVMGRGIGFFV